MDAMTRFLEKAAGFIFKVSLVGIGAALLIQAGIHQGRELEAAEAKQEAYAEEGSINVYERGELVWKIATK